MSKLYLGFDAGTQSVKVSVLSLIHISKMSVKIFAAVKNKSSNGKKI